jgi:hypothetical protein
MPITFTVNLLPTSISPIFKAAIYLCLLCYIDNNNNSNNNSNLSLCLTLCMEEQNLSTANPLLYVPKMAFFTKGRGVHKDHLTSFELALRDAGIANLNLVSVSSILPPPCKIVSRQEGTKHLQPGQIVFTIMARSATNEPKGLLQHR